MCLIVPSCAPLQNARQTPAANTPSGFPTLAAPVAGALPTGTPTAMGTAVPPGTGLPTVVVRAQSYPIPVIGDGNADVSVSKWDGPALLHARYTAGDNFGVQGVRLTYGGPGTLKTLIDAIGPYEGTVPLDFEPGQPTSRLQIVASGPWVLEIRPLGSAKPYQVPVTVNGKGDDVVVLQGGAVSSMMAIAAGSGIFAVVGYTPAGVRTPLLDELAPFTGAVAVDAEISALAIHAKGAWSLQIASK